MNKQAKENYQSLWNEFIEILPALVKNGGAGSATEYTRRLNSLFTDIFETDDKNPIQTVENHPLEAFDMLKQMQNNQSQTTFDNDSIMPDAVNHPVHYQSFNKDLNIECIDAMRAAYGDEVVSHFCICNTFKYVWRCWSKNGYQDVQKAAWYINKYLELNKE